ncbi:BglG family transcription antiterminator [Macrococcus lamae]|uniref:PRD domain-containing protein n=1 Tax=Macrococcus lamae TaxID=198484 RepID=A0A4R6BT10_9STAP|nr:BglG family transcription antiterminator [Macrococcus lamae]TDM07006.1 PRD domain-containing protein [Macrococcus lamae]
MQVSNREKRIIESLLKNPRSFLTIRQIAQDLGVSSRTIHRELKFVERTLGRFGLDLLRLPNKGLRIEGDSEHFNQLTDQLDAMDVLDLSMDERKVIILYTLIKAKDPVKLYGLASEIGISINKLNKELSALEMDLTRYHLELQKKRGEGLVLSGGEVNKRQLLADLMLERLNSTSVYSVIEDHFVYQTLNDEKLLEIVDMNQIFNVERLLMDELSELPYVLMETSYLTLTIHIVLAIERIRNGEQVMINEELIQALRVTPEFKVAENLAESLSHVYNVDFDLEEVVFITMHLRGAKRRADESETAIDITTEAEQLIAHVERLTGNDFEGNTVLREGILLHLVPALNRLSGGIETYNPLTDMIKADYLVLFEAVSSALARIFPDHSFPDGEIAFVVLHFGGAMKAAEEEQVLVVCTSGIGTSRILSNQIEQNFPNVTVARQASVSELKSIALDQFDHIISTVGLDIKQPYTVVNPLLPASDKQILAQIFTSPAVKRQKVTPMVHLNTYDAVVPFVVEGHALIDALYFHETDVLTLEDAIADYVAAHHITSESEELLAVIGKREDAQGFAITGSEIALPHLVHPLIERPGIALITLAKHVAAKNMDDDTQHVRYLAIMLLPEDTRLRPLVSEFSVLLMNHLESPDKLFRSRSFVVNHMKQALMQQVTQLIY